MHVAREIEVFANRAACAGPEDERNGASLAYWNVGDAGVLHDGKIWRHIEARYVKRHLSGTVERHRADRADSANCSVGEAQRVRYRDNGCDLAALLRTCREPTR